MGLCTPPPGGGRVPIRQSTGDWRWQHEAMPHRRWSLPVGLAVVALVVVATAGGSVGVGMEGAPLVALIALVVYCAAGLTFLLRRHARAAELLVLLAVMAVAIAAVHIADPGGPVVGLYLITSYAPMRLTLRPALAISSGSVAVFVAAILSDAANAIVFSLVVAGGAAVFFLFGLLLRREDEARRRIAGLLEQLRASREAELAATAVAERTRLAREMHDILAHTLSGLAMQLEGLITTRPDLDESELDQRLRLARNLARQGLGEARQVVAALRGAPTPGPDRIPELVAEHEALSGTCCAVRVTGQPRPLTADAGLATYRTAQEALSNIRKHDPTAEVRLDLDWGQDRLSLTIDSTSRQPLTPTPTNPHAAQPVTGSPRRQTAVSPGGCPDVPAPATFPSVPQQRTPAPAAPGFGLQGLRERATLLRGTFTAAAKPNRTGFIVRLEVPYRTTGEEPR